MAGSRNRPSPDPAQAVLAVLSRHVRPAQRVVAGLSGGLDSVVLLDCLRRAAPEVGFELSALHVHHGLSPSADSWEAHCRVLCGRWGIALTVERLHPVARTGRGIEAAAREARYAAYARSGADWVAAAHHRDDQAETLLYNLLRGAGVRGAAAMPAVRGIGPAGGPPRLLRPLLAVPRAALEDHAHRQGLEWVEDESNSDLRFARNYLRREVLTALQVRFPACKAALARAASHFAQAQELLEGIAAQDRAAIAPGGRILLDRLGRLDRSRARNVLESVLREAGLHAPDARRFDDLAEQLAHCRPDSRLRFVLDRHVLYAWRGCLYIEPLRPAAGAPLSWRGQRELPWAGGRLAFTPVVGEGLSAASLAGVPVEVRAREGGERLRPVAGGPSRSFKALVQAAGIPPWQRTRLPLVWVDGCLAWVAGIGADTRFACAAGEPGMRIEWLDP